MSDASTKPPSTDPVSQGLRLWADLWRRTARELGNLGSADDFASPFLRSLVSAGEGSSSTDGSTTDEAVGDLQQTFASMTQFYLEGLGSGLRFYARAGESLTRYVERLADRLTELSEEELADDPTRMVVDEARGALRELQTFVSQEARLFGDETKRLSEKLEKLLDEPPLSRSRPRLAKVKDADDPE